MAGWSKGKVGSFNQAAATEAAEAAVADLAGGETRIKIDIKMGLNVMLWVPQIGSMNTPYRYAPVHYRPFHMCGRGDSVDDPKKPGEFIEDKFFSKCIRCQTAWNTWDAAGRPTGPLKSKFIEDMNNFRCGIQAVNLTPFFSIDASGEFAVPNLERLKEFGEAFVQILGGGEVPEGTPDDIVEAALPGVDVVWLNRTTAKELRTAHVKQTVRAKNQDPLHSPEKYLLTFNKKKDKTFKLANGKDGQAYSYNPAFTDKDMMDGFKLPKGLIEVIEEQMIDLNNPPVESEGDTPTIEEKVNSLARISDAEMTEYLVSTGHSYHLKVEGPATEAGDVDLSDPSQFESVSDDSVLGSGSKADLNAMRAQLAADDDDDE